MFDELLIESHNPEDPYFLSRDLSVRSKQLTHKGLRIFVRMFGHEVAARTSVDPRVLIVRVRRVGVLCSVGSFSLPCLRLAGSLPPPPSLSIASSLCLHWTWCVCVCLIRHA